MTISPKDELTSIRQSPLKTVEPLLSFRIGAAVSLLFALIVGSRTLPVNGQPYLFYELVGFSRGLSLAALCDPSPTRGLEGPLDNVNSDFFSSALFYVPTKLAAGAVEPLVLNRALFLCWYLLFLLLVIMLFRALKLSRPVAFLGLVYLALTQRTIWPLLSQGLALPTCAWYAALALATVWLLKSDEQPARFAFACLLLPLILIYSYEFYAVVRPLAVLLWPLSLLYLLYVMKQKVEPATGLFLFLFSSFAGAALFHLLHPQTQLDLSLFQVRGESFLEASSGRALQRHLWRRLSELSGLLKLPHYGSFLDWHPRKIEIGCLDILALLTGATGAAVFLKRKAGSRLVATDLMLVLFLLYAAAVSLVTPILSLHPLRATRLGGLYFFAAVITLLLLHRVFQALPLRFRLLKGSLLYGAALLFALVQITALLNWKSSFPSEQARQIVQWVAENYEKLNTGRAVVAVCDQAPPAADTHPIYYQQAFRGQEKIWQTALYLGGACSARIKELWYESGGCSCAQMLQGVSGCIERKSTPGEISWSAGF